MTFVDCCLIVVKGFIRDMELLNLTFMEKKDNSFDYLQLFSDYDRAKRDAADIFWNHKENSNDKHQDNPTASQNIKHNTKVKQLREKFQAVSANLDNPNLMSDP